MKNRLEVNEVGSILVFQNDVLFHGITVMPYIMNGKKRQRNLACFVVNHQNHKKSSGYTTFAIARRIIEAFDLPTDELHFQSVLNKWPEDLYQEQRFS